jgi:hypothetical protein
MELYVAESEDTICKLYENVMLKAKEEWKNRYVVYPFLPHHRMANFM